MNKNKSKILKLIILIAVILLLVILSIELFPLFQNLTTPEGREEIEYTLEDMGWQGVFALIGLITFFYLPCLLLITLPRQMVLVL